jgi:uncharacterized protein
MTSEAIDPPAQMPAALMPATMMPDVVTGRAIVPTGEAARYLQQLCKHWQHSYAVEFGPETSSGGGSGHGSKRGMIQFPRTARGQDWPGDALLFLVAGAQALEVRIEASCAEQLAALKGAVQRHLDRFAFREAPLAFDWT